MTPDQSTRPLLVWYLSRALLGRKYCVKNTAYNAPTRVFRVLFVQGIYFGRKIEMWSLSYNYKEKENWKKIPLTALLKNWPDVVIMAKLSNIFVVGKWSVRVHIHVWSKDTFITEQHTRGRKLFRGGGVGSRSVVIKRSARFNWRLGYDVIFPKLSQVEYF